MLEPPYKGHQGSTLGMKKLSSVNLLSKGGHSQHRVGVTSQKRRNMEGTESTEVVKVSWSQSRLILVEISKWSVG